MENDEINLIIEDDFQRRIKNEESKFQNEYKLFLANTHAAQYCDGEFSKEEGKKNIKNDCFFCDDIYNSELKFKAHLMPAKKILKKYKNLECDLCKIIFTTKCGLRYHSVICHKIFCHLRCHKCEGHFRKTRHFRRHMDVCSGRKISTTKAELKADEQNICSQCRKSFNTRKLLNIHENEHKRFQCKNCEKKFLTRIMLRKHACSKKRELTKFQCPRCKNTFVSNASLVKHIFSNH